MVAERLQEVHGAGYVHCDMKLDNVTVSMSGEGEPEAVHLIDFGMARRVGGSHPVSDKPADSQWYCDCVFSGDALTPKCDLPGMAIVIMDIFLGLSYLPK